MEAEAVNDIERKSHLWITAPDDDVMTPLYYGELEAEVDLNPSAIVQLQIFTNWGHPSGQVGLTEVQFLDDNRQPLPVESITIGGDSRWPSTNIIGKLINIINGKMKTVKEKFMWSCALPAEGKPIELVFTVAMPVMYDDHMKASKRRLLRWMGIWNYNKGLKDLEVGAKDVLILVNGRVAFDGIIEKGCGNQVFEYGQFLLLDDVQQATESPYQSATPRRPSWLDDFQRREDFTVIEKSSSRMPQTTLPHWLKDYEEDLRETFERPLDNVVKKTSFDDIDIHQTTEISTSARFGRRAISATCSSRLNPINESGGRPPRTTSTVVESMNLDDLKKFNEVEFIIPELPEGRHLVINIKSTWGDRHYVGLNGIELFASCGQPIIVSNINADPADINVLQEYSDDPRVVANLINGVYRTKDDANLWLAPFTPGGDHFVYLTFDRRVKVALIRIWNYNKSRIHSHRGARYMEMSLDNRFIFKGEISKATGSVAGGTEAFGDTILFTLDDLILECIASNDINFMAHDQAINDVLDSTKVNDVIDRPTTANNNPDIDSFLSSRPRTTPAIQSKVEDLQFVGKHVEVIICSNWGDSNYIGLTGIEVVGVDDDDDFQLEHVTTNHGLGTIMANRLFDGVNITTETNHMWMTPLVDSMPITISIELIERRTMTGLRLWNYNASLEESYRGVRFLVIKIDGHQVTDEVLIRRAPGNCHFDFNQLISFQNSSSIPSLSIQENFMTSTTMAVSSPCHEYEQPVMPRGFVFQLQLLSTWGDSYYVGLNGIEMYDAFGDIIPLSEGEVAAYPDSVNVLDGIVDDVRTPDKLVDGINESCDGQHTWLSPILPGVVNRVYIIFDNPMTVSIIKLWNYAKTPSRGVKEFAVVVDDLLVYHGVLTKSGGFGGASSHRTVLFTADAKILKIEKEAAIRNDGIGQDVQMTNDSQVVHKSRSNDPIDQALRPFTSLPLKGVSKYSRQTQNIVL